MFLSKSFCFALEMARACLRQSFELPPDFRIVEMDFELNRDHSHRARRAFDMRFSLSGQDGKFSCYCDVYRRGSKGEWSYGLCYVERGDNTSLPFGYICELDAGSLHVSPMGRKLQELGLDDDLIADLARAGIDSAVKLLGLTDYEACCIFQPDVDDPFLAELPDPTGYIDNVTFDKFFRLRRQLEEKNLQLRGPRHTQYELQLML